MPNRERKRVPDDRSDILKGSLPKSPPAHPWDTENLSIYRRDFLKIIKKRKTSSDKYFILKCPIDFILSLEN